MNNDKTITISQVLKISISSVMIVIGLLVLLGVFSASDPKFWLATQIILAGIFIATTAPSISLSILGLGVVILLRDFGVMDQSLLGNGLSALIVVSSIFGIYFVVTHPSRALLVVNKKPSKGKSS